MGPFGAVVALAAVGGAVTVVLRDVVAFDRPPEAAPEPVAERPAARVAVTVAEPAPAVAPEPVAVTEPLPVAAPVREPEPVAFTLPARAHDSMLAALAATETDERTPLRRVGSALVLLALTLLTAALVGAVIYKGLAGLG